MFHLALRLLHYSINLHHGKVMARNLEDPIMKLNVEEEKDDTPTPSSEDVASPHQSSSTMLA
ncbi:Histone-lysine N-methyltransferase ASHH1 [Bienertia sinuspersici]